MDKTLRSLVVERDQWCAVCGLPLPVLPAVHHRKLRSQGGLDEACNLIALHHHCHNIAPNSVHQNPALSYERGWMVPSWGDPAATPVVFSDGRVVTYDNDGNTHTEGKHHGW
jgi:hypothetical protein